MLVRPNGIPIRSRVASVLLEVARQPLSSSSPSGTTIRRSPRWVSGQDYLRDNSALVTCDRYAELAERERARKQRIRIANLARGKGVKAFALVTPQQLAETRTRSCACGSTPATRSAATWASRTSVWR
jgi:hypothetical protein